MRDYLLTPPEVRSYLRLNLRLLPLNLALATFTLLYRIGVR